MSESMSELVERFVELYLNKQDIMKESRVLNKELRTLKPKIMEYLAGQGKNTLEVGDTQIVLSASAKKTRKKKSDYEDEVIEYLQALGVQRPEDVWAELQDMKNADTAVVTDLKVIN